MISMTDVTPAVASVCTPKTTSKYEVSAVNVGDNNNSKNTTMKQIDADFTRPPNCILSSLRMADSTLNALPLRSTASSIAGASNTTVEISNSRGTNTSGFPTGGTTGTSVEMMVSVTVPQVPMSVDVSLGIDNAKRQY